MKATHNIQHKLLSDDDDDDSDKFCNNFCIWKYH